MRRQTKNNPLRNRHALLQLNPYAKVEKRRATAAQNKRIKAKAQQLAKQAEVGSYIDIFIHYHGLHIHVMFAYTSTYVY